MKDFVGNAITGRAEMRKGKKLTEPSALDTRSNALGGAILGALAVSALLTNMAEAATLPDGYVTIDPAMGVTSANVLSDGSLELTLADGSVHHFAAGEFVVLEGGAVAVSAAVAAELGALADAAGGAGLGVEVAAGLLGAVALVASGDSQAGGGGSGGNTPAVIGGDTTGSVTEDTAATLETSGTLTVSDADTGEAVFVAQASVAGSNGYGTFTMGADGAWTYAADTTQSAIQCLAKDATLTDSFTATTADGTTQGVTVTITGVNDAAAVGGDTTGSVTEDTAATLETSGTLTVSDADTGEAVFVAQASVVGSNGYGTFTLGADGAWTYAADTTQSAIQDLDDGDSLTDFFIATTADGTSVTVTVTIAGVDDPVGIAPVSLSSIEAGTGGFVINGVSANDFSGLSVSSAGDVNGDGLEDVIVGAKSADPNGGQSGASYVVFGKTDGEQVELSSIAAGGSNAGFVINGVSQYDFSGFSVSAAGDVNGDGLADLIVGAFGDEPIGDGSGASFVVFGKASDTAVSLSDIELGTGGFVINGASDGDSSGFSVSSAGDVNGDGLDDLIVGARYADPNGSKSGASFVVFGKTDGDKVELSAIDVSGSAAGFVINGVSILDYSGFSVSSAGDVNGDGLDDLIVGAPYDSPHGNYSGASFVVFGKTSDTPVALSDIESGRSNKGFVINGFSAGDRSGFSVSSAGDVNGDGKADLIVGAYGHYANGNLSGSSFVVFGKTGGGAVERWQIEGGSGTGGFVIKGVSQSDFSGKSVSSAGDVNGDGLDDLIVGAPGDDPNGESSGASFVVFGKTDGTTIDLSTIEAGTGGFVIKGVSGYDLSGRSVSGAGDVNGDGFDDLIIGAYRDDPNGSDSGASFVVFGGDFSGAATEVGTVSDDTLTGSADEDVLVGGTGADVLKGEGGADVLYGGAGNDVLEVADLTFARVDGGTGHDTLRLTRAGVTLDLESLDNTALNSIEVVDLNGGGNSLTISSLELFRLADATNTVRVLGETGDAVTLTGDAWSRGQDLIEGVTTFAVYTQGNARLEVAEDVAVSGRLAIAPIELSAVTTGIGGFVINGATGYDYSGFSVSSAGDVNGDGLDDLIIGAWYADPNGEKSGASYVVFGKTDNTSPVQLSAVAVGNGGFVINGGSAGDYSGFSVSSAGDVNGDGLDDVIVGAYGDDRNSENAGASFVVFGKADGDKVELSTLVSGTSDAGFVINGASQQDLSGFSVSSAGDVNGDGLDDLIVGAYKSDPNGNKSGASYVVFGKSDGSAVQLSSVAAGNGGGFVMNGVSAFDYSGVSVSAAGDVNGDGLDDLIVGAKYDDPNGDNSGASFVVFGKTNGTAVELSAVEVGNGGFVINGMTAYDYSGASVSSAGDVNGDGLDDLIVGAFHSSPNDDQSGASFVVFGKTDGSVVELSDITAGSGGFVVNGASWQDFSGFSVSSAGDVNGDGFDDLLIGAYQVDVHGDRSGASYVVFGGNFTGAATEVGTIGDDSLTGTAANDVIFAGTGDDTLDGGGGSDRLSGGAGEDVFTLRNVDGTTHVVDFSISDEDTLDVRSLGYADFNDFKSHLAADGPGGQDTKLTIDADTFVILDHIKLDDLTSTQVTL